MPRVTAITAKITRHSRDVSDAGSCSGNHQLDSPVVHQFVYSKAVERAFRLQYQCDDFDQPSAKPPNILRRMRQAIARIDRLPEIYGDYMATKERLERKRNHIARLQREYADAVRQNCFLSPRRSLAMNNRFSNSQTPTRQRTQSSPWFTLPPIRPTARKPPAGGSQHS